MHDSKINTVIDGPNLLRIYHDETYMQINLSTQPRTPERNKVTDNANKERQTIQTRKDKDNANKDSSRYKSYDAPGHLTKQSLLGVGTCCSTVSTDVVAV